LFNLVSCGNVKNSCDTQNYVYIFNRHNDSNEKKKVPLLINCVLTQHSWIFCWSWMQYVWCNRLRTTYLLPIQLLPIAMQTRLLFLCQLWGKDCLKVWRARAVIGKTRSVLPLSPLQQWWKLEENCFGFHLD